MVLKFRERILTHVSTPEWPTLGVAAVCYGMFFVSTLLIPMWTLTGSIVMLAIGIALHSSLQHEVLHGHPFKQQWLCDLLVFPAIGFFVPYQRFRDTHLRHHMDPNLTDPYDDPESNYLDPKKWAGLSAISRVMLRFNNTLLGRMVIGPAIGMSSFLIGDILSMLKGDRIVMRAYVLHIVGLVPVFWWQTSIANFPIWAYIVAAYGGMSLLKIRTFLEHRAHESIPGRTVVVDDNGPLAFLFLNNNYHSVHHAHPQLPWFELPKYYTERSESFLKRNQNYVYKNYADIFRQYFLKTKDPVPHPLRDPHEVSTLKSRKDS